MKPVRLPAAATIALPRGVIFALCLLYILPGLLGRDPWKGDDAASFGVMWTMAHGGLQDWLWPHIVGLPAPEEGPLAFWLGALCIKLFGWLVGDATAARLSTAFFFLLGSVSVWYATYLLGRRSEAQPLKLAFGGQPEPRDFGRTLADGALLIYLGCLGLLLPSHETSAESLHISLVACSLYLCVRLLEAPAKRLALQLGICLGLMALTRGWVLPGALILSLVGLSFYLKQKYHRILLLVTLPAALVVTGIWVFAINIIHPFSSSPFAAWMQWNSRQIDFPDVESVTYFFKYGIWFAWPAWPFAAWAVYAWRKQEKALHIALPVTYVLCVVVLAFLNHFPEQSILLPILPPLAMLAAFGLPTMKRSAINAVDWFAVMIMTGFASIIWFAWIAMQSGWPAPIAKKVLSWAPGFVPEFNLFTFVIALAVSVAWFRLVYWRISRQPSVLWRAVVLSTGGVILCWLLLMTLCLPLINHRITYAGVAKDIAQQIQRNVHKPYNCIDSNVDPAQRAMFAYFGGLRFSGFSDPHCDLLLLQDSRNLKEKNAKEMMPEDSNYRGPWERIWQGRRAYDRDESFSLYMRKQP
ncbi:glycosyltransferase [Undibacterium sp.]|jgi:4-amino-4-deoxy-L-arabinose transferase-like glycosyltransferase|uniref:ArnT family glycosyltransferase n=1 Tax=Undibacterium sp. TaxID=1914977 RepID=UPI002C8F4137|nr:glycosyltransferase [Undibacterium sp.]HTD03317.1 glycosyltransferase [Undibacterium sp.]